MAETHSIFLLQCAIKMAQIQAVDAEHFTPWTEFANVHVHVQLGMPHLLFIISGGLVLKTGRREATSIEVREYLYVVI